RSAGAGGARRHGRRRGLWPRAELLAEQQFATDPGDGRTHRGDPGGAEELAPVDGARHRVLLRVPPRPCRSGSRVIWPGVICGAEARNSHRAAATPASPPMTTGMTSPTWLA